MATVTSCPRGGFCTDPSPQAYTVTRIAVLSVNFHRRLGKASDTRHITTAQTANSPHAHQLGPGCTPGMDSTWTSTPRHTPRTRHIQAQKSGSMAQSGKSASGTC